MNLQRRGSGTLRDGTSRDYTLGEWLVRVCSEMEKGICSVLFISFKEGGYG